MQTSSGSKVLRQTDQFHTDAPLIMGHLDDLEKIMAHHGLYERWAQEFTDSQRSGEVPSISQKRRDFSDPSLYIFVFGKGKFGKSSVINQLLGRTVADEGVVPQTWRIDFFRPLSEEQVLIERGEYAVLVRANSSTRERVTMEEAKSLCFEQEKAVLKHNRRWKRELEKAAADPATAQDTNVGLAVEDQIIEVNWYYQNLALPASTVLVDTPGLFQNRGDRRSQTQVMSSAEGVIFDSPDAAYEYYYPRADIVLWLFRADMLNDRDTKDALRELSEQRKRVLGIVTHMDALSTQQQRQDAMRQLQQEYGSYVEGFLPIIAGGETPYVGYGVPRVRNQVEQLGPKATQLKQEAARRFVAYVAQSCDGWLTEKGTALIGNITKIAVYCNLTSEALLQEMRYCHAMLGQTLAEEIMPQKSRPDLGQLIARILREEIPRRPEFEQARVNDSAAQDALDRYYQERISEELRLDDLHKDALERLQIAADKIVAAGRQAAAGRRLDQVVLKSGGRAESRPLESIILPPDVSKLVVALPSIEVPLLSMSGTDFVLDFLGGTFLGGIMRGLGWQDSDEKFAPLLLKVKNETIYALDALPKQIEEILKNFTMEAASAIVDGADEAIGRVYPNQNLSSLKAEACTLDRDLTTLRGIETQYNVGSNAATGRGDAIQFSYETLYTLWSPRDNAREAVIQMFCDWFASERVTLQNTAKEWFAEHSQELLADANVYKSFRGYLQETKQQKKMTAPALISSVLDAGQVDGLADLVVGHVRELRLWDDTSNFLGVQFEHFQLGGIAADFSEILAQGVLSGFQREIDQETVFLEEQKSTERFNAVKEVLNRKTLLNIFITALVVFPLAYMVMPHAWTVHAHLMVEKRVMLDTSAVTALWLWFWRWCGFLQRGEDQFARLVAAQAIDASTRAAQRAFTSAAQRAFTSDVEGISPAVARGLIGRLTLVKKRALDYAAEGQYSATG